MHNAARLSARPMGRRQIVAVAVAIALNAIDGFDVLAITFAAPLIARAWATTATGLGAAISAGLAGMTLGSLLLAPIGDRAGRRPLVLGCTALMGLAMLMTATATSLPALCAWRLATGIGIGGMLAAISAATAEYASERRRDLALALMTVGYPLGGLVGGFASAWLVGGGWQAIFVAGGVLTLLFLPVIGFGMPESVAFLERRGRAGDGARVDRLMRRLGHEPVPADAAASVAAPVAGRARIATAMLFAPEYRRLTILLTLAYLLHILAFYFFAGWLPKLMTDLGFAAPDAIRTSAIMSMGGVAGGALSGWAAPRIGLSRLVPGVMVGTTLTMAVFAQMGGLAALQTVAFLVGACIFGGIVGLYALLMRGFPADLRVTGAGLTVGIGRGGAIVGPVLGGLLIDGGVAIGTCITIVGLSSLGAAVAARAAMARMA